MSKSPVLNPDDRLALLGRQWFADLRRQNPPEPATTPRKDRADPVDGSGGIVDWLFGDSDCDGGDSCD